MMCMLSLSVQVAFGSDFTERMNDKSLELKKKKGYGIRTLVSMCSKGVDNTIRRPGYEVILYNDLYYVDHDLSQNTSIISLHAFQFGSICIPLRQQGIEMQSSVSEQ